MLNTNQFFKQGYMGIRPDVLKMIPKNPRTVLDIGCGAGGMGLAIKKRFPKSFITGIDSDAKLIKLAAPHFDQILLADINSISFWDDLKDDFFDVIIFADILEHLLDPYSALKASLNKVKKDGHIITCIPNIRHYSTFYYLLFRGTWPSNDRGIFDKSHLHYYTRKDLMRLYSSVGLKIIRENRNVRIIEPWSWTNIPGKIFDFWPFRPFLTFQYLHLCSLSK